MALGSLPPWLVPPDFIGAMQAGARTGLAERGEQREETSAGSQLKLAYDQLAKQERIATLQAQTRLKLGEAANALKLAHEDALSKHYQTIEAIHAQAAADRKASFDLQTRKEGALEAHQQAMEDRAASHDAMVDAHNLVMEGPKPTPPGSVEWDEKGKIKSIRGAPDSSSAQFGQKYFKSEADKAAAEAATPTAAGQFLRKLAMPFTQSGGFTKLKAQAQSDDAAKQAHAAIAAGADETAVKERYKKLTGKDLE